MDDDAGFDQANNMLEYEQLLQSHVVSAVATEADSVDGL